MDKKKRLIAVFALVFLVATSAGIYYFAQQERHHDNTITLYGNVDIRELALAFRQPGRLQHMAVDEGAAVKAGDLLATLDDQPFKDALAQADAQLSKAQAALQKLRAGSRQQDIQQAQERVHQAQANARKAEADYKRLSALAQLNAVSAQDYDYARAAHEDAKASLAAAQQALSLQHEGYRQEDIAAGEADMAAALAAQAQAKTALADTQLYAPSDGVVLARVLEPGSMVSPQQPVYTLSLRSPVYVRAYVSTAQLGRIANGTPVQITTDASDKVYKGHIGFISPRAEFTPKAVETASLRTDLVYRLRIVVTSDDSGLNQGAPVTIKVLAAQQAGHETAL